MLLFKAFLDPFARGFWSGKRFGDHRSGGVAAPAPCGVRLDIDLAALETMGNGADDLWLTQPAVAYFARRDAAAARH